MKTISLHALKNYLKRYDTEIRFSNNFLWLSIGRKLFKETDSVTYDAKDLEFYICPPDIYKISAYSDCVSGKIFLDETDSIIFELSLYKRNEIFNRKDHRCTFKIMLLEIPDDLQKPILIKLMMYIENRYENVLRYLEERKLREIKRRILIKLETMK